MAQGDVPFAVTYPEGVRANLRELVAQARSRGGPNRILSALRTIDQRLKRDPCSFGEPKFRYEELKLVLYVAIEFPLVVHFTVHENLPLVFVKAIFLLPGHDL